MKKVVIEDKAFITVELASFILQSDKVADIYLLNNRGAFDEETLLAAHQREQALISKYEKKFLAKSEYGAKDYEWTSGMESRFLYDFDYVEDLSSYIIDQERKLLEKA